MAEDIQKRESPATVLLLIVSLVTVPAALADNKTPSVTVQDDKLVQVRDAFKTKSVRRIGNIGLRYTMTYTGPDRHYKSIRFGLYPEKGQAHAYSILSGWLYNGREYPVSFECHKLARISENNLRLLLDQVDFH